MQAERSPQSKPRRDLPELPRGAWLAAVVAAHGLVLGGIAFGLSKPPEPVTPPTVAGIVIATAPAAPAPAPKPAAAKPKPKPKPKQAPKPKPRPPAPPAPPSERAVTVPVESPAPVESDDLPLAPEEDAPSASSEVTDVDPSATGEPSLGSSAVGQAEEPPITQPRSDASHLSNPAPRYPTLSRRFGEEGRVLLDVYILPDGTVGEIRLNTSSGFKRLDEAALTAVRNWRFVPARRGESPIPFWYVQPVTFSLDR